MEESAMFPWFALAVAQAQTVYEVPHDFETVAAAVTAASPGDIIEVDAGTDWTRDEGEDVWIEKELEVRGVNGTPVLPRLVINSAAVTLKNVALQGVGRENVAVGVDAALLANLSDLTLLDVVVASRPLGAGYGVVANDSTVWAERITGSGLALGPALTVVSGSLDVREGSFQNNVAGAIAATDADIDIQGGTFYGNLGYAGSDIAVSNTELHTLSVTDSTFEFSSATIGGAIFASTAAVTLEDCSFTEGFAFDSGGAVVVYGELEEIPLTISGCSFTSNTAETAGALVALNLANAVVEDTSFTDNHAAVAGAVQAAFGHLSMARTTFVDNTAVWSAGSILLGADADTNVYGTGTTMPTGTGPTSTGSTTYGTPTTYYYTGYTGYTWPTGVYDPYTSVNFSRVDVKGVDDTSDVLVVGGCLYGDVNVDLELVDSTLRHCGSDIAGGAIGFYGNRLEIYDSVLRDNDSGWGAAIDQTGGILLVQDTVLMRNNAGLGAAIRASDVDASLLGLSVLDNHAGSGGVIELGNLFGFQMHHSRVCGNSSESTGAIVNITGGTSPGFAVKNNVWMDNTADLGAALRYVPADWLGNNGPPLDVHNNDFLHNGVSSAVVVRGQVDFTNNIVGGHPIGFLLDAAPWGNALSGGYNLWVENAANAAGTEGRFPGSGAVLDLDPLFQGYVEGNCASNLWLSADSPARDVGDPTIFDVDGGPSDIGAFGGPDSGLEDADEDGYLEDLDCDDDDPSIRPGIPDIPYDGIDNDCDGFDLCDGDGDGFDAEACGGNDCDDTNAKVHPRAKDVPDDGLDNNCDDFKPRTWVAGGGGCGCAQEGGSTGVGGLALLALLGIRRRR